MALPTAVRRRRRMAHARRPNLWLWTLGGLAALTATLALVLIAAAAVTVDAVYRHFSADLPTAEQVEEMTLTSFETTKIYDRTGRHLLFEVQDPLAGDRTIVPLQDIPVYLRNATIAMEDKTFYDNPFGINVEGLLRAFYSNLMGNQIQGGSSITAQLVRNVAMTTEERFSVSYERKIREVILSYELTKRYPGKEGRDRILEWYLNTISYGRTAVGVEAAAKMYFGKHARDLTLAEAAMLVAIPQYPAMNPIDDFDAAKARQCIVLDVMAAQGYITKAQAEAAKKAPLSKPKPPEKPRIEAPHFVMHLLKVMEERYGRRAVYGGGLRVITTLDWDLQNAAQQIVSRTITGFPPTANASNGAAVIIRPSTGEVLAMVGSVDYFNEEIDGQVNMAIEPRQPGSSFKPYTYAAAFERGLAPATVIYDVSTAFPLEGQAPYAPKNFDNMFHGPVPIRRALACSYNIPAVSVLKQIGIDAGLEMAHRLGITTIRDRRQVGLALTLGAAEVSLLDHTYAYSVLANGGVMAGVPVPEGRRIPGYRALDPVMVLKVTDGRGRVLDEFVQPARAEVLDPRIAYMISSILSDNAARTPAFGPNSALVTSRPAAAKTGTTNQNWDCWTMGYNPQLAVGVWVGNADRKPMGPVYGSISAAPIWRDIMEYAWQSLPVADFAEPRGLLHVEVDADTGLLPGPLTQRRVKDLFMEGRLPRRADDAHRPFAICRATGKLATPYCPPDQVDTQVFWVHPPEAADWVRATEQPQPPTAYCDEHGPNLRAAEVSITFPGIYQPVHGLVQVTGNARPGGMREWQLEYGAGLQPSQWFPIGSAHGHRVENNVLEQWDTTGLSGLYTLRLTVRGSQDWQVSMPIIVDNEPPAISIMYPYNDAQYIKEVDELLNLQADALDNVGMDRVEFLVDGQKVAESRVAPYSIAWTLVMTDVSQAAIPPVPDFQDEQRGEENGQPFLWRKEASGDGTLFIHELGSGESVSRTLVYRGSAGVWFVLPSGWGASWITDATGRVQYREIHTLEAVAYDAAGNQTRAEPVRISVIHKPKETQ
ncbi:MAG: penicillin-binding protein [Anaerolineae bacterium]